MPVYDYKCVQCGHRFEQLRAISQRDAAVCPRCGAAITDHSKGFMCENRICGFVLWKTGGILKGAEHPLTASEVKALVENGSVHKKGLVSAKSHIKYDATLHLDYNKNGKPVLRPTFD